MIEAYAAGARALAVLSAACLIGTPLFLMLAGPGDAPAVRAWRERLQRAFPLAALALLITLLGLLHAQASGAAGGLATVDFTRAVAVDTAFGRIGLLRLALASMLLPVALLAATGRAFPLAAAASALLATTILGAGPLSGHAAGTPSARMLVTIHVVHVLAIACWIGALPAWIALAGAVRRDADTATTQAYAAQAMRRFSRFAVPCMAVIVVTGGLIALEFVDDQGDLLGTRYGVLLCLKITALLGVLVIANGLRTRWLPRLETPSDPALLANGARRVGSELLFASGVLVLGAGLAQTTPAIHDQPHWWLPWRLSFDASAELPGARIAVYVGASLLFAAAWWWVALGVRHGRAARRGAAVLGVTGIATGTWGLAVPAFPDTFLRSPVPYLTLSIDSGRRAFAENCVACHGLGGLGDGERAPTLRRPPADLSAPHTALHTAGDLYWWITNGMPEGPMPGFASVLDEEQRWDTVNFLRVFSQGFQARVITPRIVPRGPWLGAPDFYYATADGGRAQLKDLRGVSAALIVFAVADDPRSLQRLASLRSRGSGHLAIVAPTSDDVWQSYQFLTRTFSDRGAPDRLDMPRRHAEFLVDRFGYVRARWLPDDDPVAAADFDLDAAVMALAEEPEILPPPDLHLH